MNLSGVVIYYELRAHLSMNILVTGWNGFVGSGLIDYLDSISDLVVTGVCRNKQYSANSDKKVLYISD
jgi:nucleoside-diphosphate-sugar epimerase